MDAPRIDDPLPPGITNGARLRGGEYGWDVAAFPAAIAEAERRGYACLGGQFQFRLGDGSTCEMYWLAADSNDRGTGESWIDYCRMSCEEVGEEFQRLIRSTDFAGEARKWTLHIDPARDLVFVAYFVREAELAHISR